MGLQGAINGPMSVSDCYIIPLAAHLMSILIICTVNIHLPTSNRAIQQDYKLSLQQNNATHVCPVCQICKCISPKASPSVIFAGNPYSWRRSSLQSTLYEASIAMQGMSYGGPPVARPHGTYTQPSKAARLEPKTSTRARKRARGGVREGGREGKRKKVLSSPQDCPNWDTVSARNHQMNHHLDHEQNLSKRMERKLVERKEGNG